MTRLKLCRTPMSKRSGKWIEDLTPNMPASKAARKTLKRRFRPVMKWLADAAQSADESTEHVHQLRVAVRRAMAALHGYAELLPAKKAAKIEKRLGQIRKRAGDARDFDVLIERFGALDDAPHWRPLVRRFEELREEAQRPIVKLYHKLKTKDFARRLRKTAKRIETGDDAQQTTLLQWARLGLSRGVEAFFAAGAADLNDVALLHQFRIEGKHLRYAMEYFGCAFGPTLRSEIYPEIEKLQVVLGEVYDHVSAIAHFETWNAEWDDAELRSLLEQRLAFERDALHSAKQEFFRWWTPQRAADLRRRFAELLQLPDEEHAA